MVEQNRTDGQLRGGFMVGMCVVVLALFALSALPFLLAPAAF
jgi:hypothetical protein